MLGKWDFFWKRLSENSFQNTFPHKFLRVPPGEPKQKRLSKSQPYPPKNIQNFHFVSFLPEFSQ